MEQMLETIKQEHLTEDALDLDLDGVVETPITSQNNHKAELVSLYSTYLLAAYDAHSYMDVRMWT
jgi:hypothetical protein